MPIAATTSSPTTTSTRCRETAARDDGSSCATANRAMPPDAVSTIASPAAGSATAAATGPAGSFFGTPGLALTTPPVARPLTGYSSSGTALPWPSSCITRSMSPVATPAVTTRSPRSRFMPATPPAAGALHRPHLAGIEPQRAAVRRVQQDLVAVAVGDDGDHAVAVGQVDGG